LLRSRRHSAENIFTVAATWVSGRGHFVAGILSSCGRYGGTKKANQDHELTKIDVWLYHFAVIIFPGND
jgi:hypothetical protein